MGAQDKLGGETLAWLLEKDPENPGVRYFALTELEGRPPDDPEANRRANGN